MKFCCFPFFTAFHINVKETEDIAQNIEDNGENTERLIDKEANSRIIRVADDTVKHRVLLEKQAFGYDICYRRVKHTNELVINGNVYDEIEAIVEFPHVLQAYLEGHRITAGYNGVQSFISVDGENVAKKVRFI